MDTSYIDKPTTMSQSDIPVLQRKEFGEDSLILRDEILYIVINFVAIIADVTVIYTIVRFQNIRTQTRIFIMNWSITDLAFLIFNSSMCRLYSKIHETMEIYEFYCMFSQVEYLILSLKAGFVLMLHSDFAFKRLNLKTFKFTVLICWGIFIILGVISACYCSMQTYNGFPILLYILTFALLLGSVFCKTISAIRKKERRSKACTNLRAILTSVYVLCWFISWLCLVVDVSVEASQYTNEFLLATAIGNAFGYGNAILNLILFVCLDKTFQKALLHVLTCSKIDVSDEEGLRDENMNGTVSFLEENSTSRGEEHYSS